VNPNDDWDLVNQTPLKLWLIRTSATSISMIYIINVSLPHSSLRSNHPPTQVTSTKNSHAKFLFSRPSTQSLRQTCKNNSEDSALWRTQIQFNFFLPLEVVCGVYIRWDTFQGIYCYPSLHKTDISIFREPVAYHCKFILVASSWPVLPLYGWTVLRGSRIE